MCMIPGLTTAIGAVHHRPRMGRLRRDVVTRLDENDLRRRDLLRVRGVLSLGYRAYPLVKGGVN